MSFKLFHVDYVNGVINLPGSKSISNRILLMSSLSNNNITILKNFLFCDDTYYMIYNLKLLGINIITYPKKKICIINTNNFHNFNNLKNKISHTIKLYVENAGTVMRFLTSILSLYKCNIILDGNKRMRNRPIKDLVNALLQGNAKIEYLKNIGYPPLLIKGGFTGGNINILGNISSQFISSLLFIAPLTKKKTIIYTKNIVSKPYINITIKLLNLFKIKIINNKNYFFIKNKQKYISPKVINIEGDATALSYFLAATTIKGNKILINGIGKNTIQGDINFCHLLTNIGSNIIIKKNYIICSKANHLKGIHGDMNHIPDAAMTIASMSPFINSTFMLKNIFNWRIKETDRLLAISNILNLLGLTVITGKNYIYILPFRILKCKIIINTYNDHRIAMCFSLLSLIKKLTVFINNYNCINKTFPNFFNLLKYISYNINK